MSINPEKQTIMKKRLLIIMAGLLALWNLGMEAKVRRQAVSDNNKEAYSGIAMQATPDGATRAGDECVYGYSLDPYTAYKFNEVKKGVYVYFATEFQPSDLALFKGSKIAGMYVYGGINIQYNKNPNKDITVFLTYDLKAEPFYKEDVTISTVAFGKNRVDLTTPQDFDPTKPLYMGYYFKATNLTQYCMVVDGYPTTGNTAMLAFGTGEKVPQTWKNQAPEGGSLCFAAIFKGNNLPANMAQVCAGETEVCYLPGQQAEYDLIIRNIGTSPLTTAKLKLDVTGEEVYTEALSETGLASGTAIEHTITAPAFKNPGQKTVTATIPEVNGNANAFDSKLVLETVCSDQTWARKAVVEEGTGTWCQWCPAGIVILDYCKEKYPDDIYRIAAHTSDIMQVNSYVPWLREFAGSVPSAIMNRSYGLSPQPQNPTMLTDIDDYVKYMREHPIYIATEIRGIEYVPNDTVSVDTYTTFGVDLTRGYSVSAAVVEDGMGPYNQANVYSSGAYGEMGGWEKMGGSVEHIYDDVARYLNAYPTVNNLPASIEKGKPIQVKIPVSVAEVTNKKFRIIVMVTDDKTGEILTAAQGSFEKSGVEDIVINDSQTSISVNGRMIEITGEGSIYTLSGIKVADGSSEVPAGIYVVRAGSKTLKVAVR